MRYHGFSARDYLILDNIPISKEISVLEIGVGTGSTAELIIGKVKEFCGVDISKELIEVLSATYRNNNSVNFYRLDVCSDASLGKRFNVIYSADTLEHVKQPKGFFNFIVRHLSFDGIAVVTFPSESEVKHHGITWFNSKTDLLMLIDSVGLKVDNLSEVRETIWHKIIRKYLWDLPKSLVSRQNITIPPQTFEQTEAFQIIQDGGIKVKFFACYAKTITRMAALFSLYNYFEVSENINNKNLLIHLKHK
jgi:SAM-dependent methyltransferase